MYTLDRTTFTTRNMVKISILAVISMVLMIFDNRKFVDIINLEYRNKGGEKCYILKMDLFIL